MIRRLGESVRASGQGKAKLRVAGETSFRFVRACVSCKAKLCAGASCLFPGTDGSPANQGRSIDRFLRKEKSPNLLISQRLVL